MDIDSPPTPYDPHAGHSHLLSLPPLSASFPLPFRVLTLLGLSILLWATNLHLLHIIGLDTAWVLDYRDNGTPSRGLELDPSLQLELELENLEPLDPSEPSTSTSGGGGIPALVLADLRSIGEERPKLYIPVYKLFVIYTLWVGAGWLIFHWVTGGEEEAMEGFRGWVVFVALGPVLGVLVPWKGVGERERRGLRRSLKRILVPSLVAPIFFCDVILADILTSFAKVLGDLWVSSCQVWNGGITQGRVRQEGWSGMVTLTMVSLPYLLRFRQCLYEFHQTSYTSPRPLFNALKYFSAFPVIFFSALQRVVVSDIAQQKGISVDELASTHDRWFGEHRLFRLWLLAVVVNSIFSFWWDVKMDWGLALCDIDTWLPRRTPGPGSGSPRDLDKGRITWLESIKRLWTRRTAGIASSPLAHLHPNHNAHQRSPAPSPIPRHHSSPSTSASSSSSAIPRPAMGLGLGVGLNSLTTFGLRSTLLLPDPLIYHLFTAIDLILRFTWSLKLSSHLHTIAEIESGVFMMEALELVRRWMWIFVRIEWEAVKMGSGSSRVGPAGTGIQGARSPGQAQGVGEVVWSGDKAGV